MPLKCPEGMISVDKGTDAYANEPAFCMNETEIEQRFFAEHADIYNGPLARESKLPPPDWPMVGPRKPVWGISGDEAREFCQKVYKDYGGDLPTKAQWRAACGLGEFCTASGSLNKFEAVYGTAVVGLDVVLGGPFGVASGRPNTHGFYDMTGNVAEWIIDKIENGAKMLITGGHWLNSATDQGRSNLEADHYHARPSDTVEMVVGFRCAAKPKEIKEPCK